jgi:hypothetical protein
MTIDLMRVREPDPRRSAGRLVLVTVAAAVAVSACPLTVWWLTGDLSTVPLGESADYAIRPPHIDPAVERGIGVAALTVMVAALVFLGYATAKRAMRGRWWVVVGPLLLAGLVTGLGWRIVTAGVIGANIGAGLVVLFGCPVVAACGIWSSVWSVVLVRGRRTTA